MQSIRREQVLAARWFAQQLERPDATSDDCDLLDLGVQDTGPDGAPWALTIRGMSAAAMEGLTVAWTVRGAPHYYRRADLDDVAVAVSPYSSPDAAKRIFDANKKFKDAGVDTLVALRELATTMRAIVTDTMVKGEMSSRLTTELPEHHLRDCKPCGAVHPHEQTFRLAALQAGLELVPNTSPPVLHRVKGLRPNEFRRPDADASPQFDLIRNYLRFYGPSTAQEVAAFLDAPVKEVKAHWPDDVLDVDVEGQGKSALIEAIDVLTDPPQPTAVRLAGPYDALLQGRDREMLVPEVDRRKTVWPVLGRPGVIFAAAEPVGTWRPAKAGKKLRIKVEPWVRHTTKVQKAIAVEAERLARFRGVELAGIDTVE
ncbi:DNA glycosylase AlkZ-like family protein [Williamsia muralis]|uniref:DNA glycosylase AlkZ-like family protein n=1 Tax=Williamsia marianensis TaxID=85044 RepID=UPI000DE63BEB|nr:crosslink repair DNA glycosylase YcaQ family protein [Williamsia marianensis]PVY34225.1 winged helix DNA-binding protein [Williamsia marianensis]